MEIGKKLKNARVQSGMTQENVAEKINVSRQTISNWENEKSYPDIINVIELSNLYSISLDELLKGDGKMVDKVLVAGSDTVSFVPNLTHKSINKIAILQLNITTNRAVSLKD